MLFRPSTLKGIAEGTVTRAYRRWDRPRVRPGGRQRTPAGVVAFDSVEPVARESLTDADALAAGLTGLDELLELVDRRPAGEIYRVDLHLAGPDPRVALRESTPDDGGGGRSLAPPRPSGPRQPARAVDRGGAAGDRRPAGRSCRGSRERRLAASAIRSSSMSASSRSSG